MLRIRPLALLPLLAAAGLAQAATPDSGTLSIDERELVYESGPFLISNPTASVQPGGVCNEPAQPCDHFDLTVQLPEDFETTQPDAVIQVSTVWDNPAEDYDIYLMDADGTILADSATSANPEEMQILAGQGMRQLRIRILPFAVAGGVTTTTIKLVVPQSGDDDEAAQEPAEAAGPPPRFYYFQSPEGRADGAGEPTIGFNPETRNAMFVAGLEVDRVTFAENLDTTDAAGNPLPASCEPEWVDKSYSGAVNTLDPILETEQSVGRTFQSQLSGANSIFAFTDDDGETWTPAQIGPPNGGVDHQTVGTGPYSDNYLGPRNPDGYAVYYCSQSIAAAFCARSDDGGLTFGPGVPIVTPTTDCDGSLGALHGHVQVADDGTVYVPFGSCGGTQAVSVSEDSGLSWTVKPVPDSLPGDDPGLGVASDGTLYFCYVDNLDKQPRAVVSHDKGDSWENRFNLGKSHRIFQAVFPTTTAGDPDRAACAWLGSQDRGNGEAENFEGIWHPYVSTTYDGGETWQTVNVSPNDPVQGFGGICLSGIACGSNRNLLDFNDVIHDDQGRILFAHADGCTGACVQDPSQNTFADNGVIARQSGGRGLLAEFDAAPGTRFNRTPLPPEAACVRNDKSIRTARQTRLVWNAPDNGGEPVTDYTVLRAPSATGPFTPVGNTGGKTEFTEPNPNPDGGVIYYKVVAQNDIGQGPESNVVELPVSEVEKVDTCSLPGQIVAQDEVGDGTGAPEQDIDFIAVAEPAELEGHFAITLKVGEFSAGQPAPGMLYTVEFGNGLYIAYDSTVENSQSSPFTFGQQVGGNVSCCDFQDEGVLDERSTFGADGTFVFVVPKDLFDKAEPGDPLVVTGGRVRAVNRDTSSRDFIDSTRPYTVQGTADCGGDGKVLATLEASEQRGEAPFTVEFTVSGQADGAEMKSFSLDFGDGQQIRNRDFQGRSEVTVSHTYQQPGNYAARASVTTTDGRTSSNVGEKFIEVSTRPRDTALAERGGALGGMALLLLSTMLWGRRRKA